jgi:hypothetical protein
LKQHRRPKNGTDESEEVATKLVEYCRKGEWIKAVDDLYAKDIVSVEPHEMGNMPAKMRGIDQVRGKTEWWKRTCKCTTRK